MQSRKPCIKSANVVTSDNSNTGQPKPQAQPKSQGQANDVTVIVGYSIMKRIDGYQLGRIAGQKVVSRETFSRSHGNRHGASR